MKKKQRGLRRECRNIVRFLAEQTKNFPATDDDYGYWHLHFCASQNLVEAASTRFRFRRFCAQILIDRAQHLAAIAPQNETPTRIVVLLDFRDLWSSQIIVFYGAAYFGKFFNRDTASQKWTPLEPARSLSRDLNLQLPPGFSQRGYIEEINDEDGTSVGEIWFVGQLELMQKASRVLAIFPTQDEQNESRRHRARFAFAKCGLRNAALD